MTKNYQKQNIVPTNATADASPELELDGPDGDPATGKTPQVTRSERGAWRNPKATTPAIETLISTPETEDCPRHAYAVQIISRRPKNMSCELLQHRGSSGRTVLAGARFLGSPDLLESDMRGKEKHRGRGTNTSYYKDG